MFMKILFFEKIFDGWKFSIIYHNVRIGKHKFLIILSAAVDY